MDEMTADQLGRWYYGDRWPSIRRRRRARRFLELVVPWARLGFYVVGAIASVVVVVEVVT